MSAAPAIDVFRTECGAMRPEVFVVLGSGMGLLVERVRVKASLLFEDVPGLPGSTVAGHRGRFALGTWAGVPVLLAEGRLHYYEGHDWPVVVRPIQFAAELGATLAILTNAAGGIRDDLGPGSLMPLRDQIEWNTPWPWRQPPPASPYSPALLKRIAAAEGASAPGTYGAVTGPTYETPAEIRALRAVGADAVGMSTSREARAGVAAGLQLAGISLITNRAAGLSETSPNHEEVLATARKAADRLADLIEAVIT